MSPCRVVVSQYSFSFSSLVKELCYLVKNNNIQNKDHISYPPLLLVRSLSITDQWSTYFSRPQEDLSRDLIQLWVLPVFPILLPLYCGYIYVEYIFPYTWNVYMIARAPVASSDHYIILKMPQGRNHTRKMEHPTERKGSLIIP